jgi:hypothetical protein
MRLSLGLVHEEKQGGWEAVDGMIGHGESLTEFPGASTLELTMIQRIV